MSTTSRNTRTAAPPPRTSRGLLSCTLVGMDASGKVLAREYLRVSRDRSGRERSNGEQQDDNRFCWPEFTFVDPPYSDAVSASRYATKTRGDYEALIEDLRRDRFGANVLVLWEGSRGSRRVGEWVELIELCEDRSVRIAVTEDDRVYDPANARDRKSLLENATDAEYESAKISARSKRAQAANAAAGRPNGAVPFGYQRRYDPVTRQLVAQEPYEPEAKVVRELFDRLKAGHSLRGIAADFEARGIRTRSGRAWSGAHLRSVARRHCYVGERMHTPRSENMGHDERRRNATITKAVWPAIVDRRTWLAVQRILDDPARRTVRPGRARHWLSMIARCDPCSGPLAVTFRRRKYEPLTGEYYCREKGCVRVDKVGLDEFAQAAIVGYLSRPEHIERLIAEDGNDEALAQVRVEMAEIQAELDDLADRVGRGELSATLASRAEPQLLERLRNAQRREEELATPSALRGLIEPGDDVAARWEEAPVSAKRRIARMLFVPEVLGELRVTRSPSPGHRVPAPDRVVFRTTETTA